MVSGCNLSCRGAGVSAFALVQREAMRLTSRVPDKLQREVLFPSHVEV